MRLRGFLFVLAVSIIADAHIATVFAGHHAIVEPTCGGLPTLTRDVRPAGLQRMKPLLSAASQRLSTLLQKPTLASSTLEHVVFPNGHWHQDQLHDLVHVSLC